MINRNYPCTCLAAAALVCSSVTASAQEPSISSVKRVGNDVELKFTGAAGVEYTLQQSETLEQRSWLPTGVTITGTGVEQIVLVPGVGIPGKNFLRFFYTFDPVPSGYVRIPSGSFIMGDQNVPYEGLLKERPPITTQTGAFHLKATEVTKAEWDATFTWAVANEYTFSNSAGAGKGPDHPVTNVNWYDVIKWCNAKSEQEGRQPCYTLRGSDGRHTVYRTGSPTRIIWEFGANGYRLPCEAEWEKAARGGGVGRRFPSGTTIDHSVANFFASLSNYAYDTTGIDGMHPAYITGAIPYTAPVASFPPNPYGLYDMDANVREYCWDTSTSDWAEGYVVKAESSSSLFPRAVRGGDWSSSAFQCRSSYRSQEFPDTGKKNYLGFRLVKGPLN